MRLVNSKTDGIDSMPAANYNAQRDELENAVLSADITLDPDAGPDTDLNMLGKAIAAYANAGNVYQDSGVADAYVLSLTTNLKTVTKYYDNMMVVFKAGNANTGASTINVNTLGVKSFTLSDGTALAAGNVSGGRYMLAAYSLSNDRFELVTGAPASSLEFNVYIHATDGDYPTLAAYLAAAPVAGDSVLYDASETIAATFTIPGNIAITFTYSSVFTVSNNTVSPAFSIGDNVRFDGRLNIKYTNAGVQAKMISLNGDQIDIQDIIITGTASGTITNGVTIEVGKEKIHAWADFNIGVNLIVTTLLDDNSGKPSNQVEVAGTGLDIARSDGANTFTQGIKTDNVTLKTKVLTAISQDMSAAAPVNIPHGLTGNAIIGVIGRAENNAGTEWFPMSQTSALTPFSLVQWNNTNLELGWDGTLGATYNSADIKLIVTYEA